MLVHTLSGVLEGLGTQRNDVWLVLFFFQMNSVGPLASPEENQKDRVAGGSSSGSQWGESVATQAHKVGGPSATGPLSRVGGCCLLSSHRFYTRRGPDRSVFAKNTVTEERDPGCRRQQWKEAIVVVWGQGQLGLGEGGAGGRMRGLALVFSSRCGGRGT